jgi:hypothetical protein
MSFNWRPTKPDKTNGIAVEPKNWSQSAVCHTVKCLANPVKMQVVGPTTYPTRGLIPGRGTSIGAFHRVRTVWRAHQGTQQAPCLCVTDANEMRVVQGSSIYLARKWQLVTTHKVKTNSTSRSEIRIFKNSLLLVQIKSFHVVDSIFIHFPDLCCLSCVIELLFKG